MKNILIISLLSLGITNCFSQTFNSQRLDSLFHILKKNDQFMGSISVSHNGKLIYSNAIGYDDVENSKKSDTQTRYRIGSISKMFTASLIFKAVEEEKITLNQTIEKYFPTIKNANKITIGNLLNHRSGIHDFTRDEDYLKWHTEFQSREKMMERISSAKSEFEPNEKSDYSNANYVLLSYMLESIYNKPLKEILNQKITTPLKLKNTYYGGKIIPENKECYSYTFLGKWKKENETDLSIPLGAGAIVSTPSDLSMFIEQLFSGNIISEQSLVHMKTIKDGYGMGMFQFPYYDKICYGHTGGIDGFASVLSYFPEEKVAVSLTTNGVRYDNNSILLCALSCFYDKPFKLPIFNHIELKAEELDKYIGIYSSEQIPPKITISKESNTLLAQATGQSSFPLEASDINIFKFKQAGVIIEFNPEKKQMILKQGGKEFLFTKE